jgi:hypothetical protein
MNFRTSGRPRGELVCFRLSRFDSLNTLEGSFSMNSKLLIHSIMRQTTVLIAQLSTASGIRAPLSHIADRVFLNLANEIEAQGVARKVVADMFGLALRSYQKKVQRLTESASAPNRTLWEALLEFLQDSGSVTRQRIFERFKYDGTLEVGAVLNDLVHSGLIYVTGKGDCAIYGIASVADQKQLAQHEDADAMTSMIWLSTYRHPQTYEELVAAFPSDPRATKQAIDTLVAEGRLKIDGSRTPATFKAETFLVPVGTEQGWEAAVFDHFQTVAKAIAAKARRGKNISSQDDTIGGATLSFDLTLNHPYAAEVLGLLAKVRKDVNELWGKVSTYNQGHPIQEADKTRVSFYFGQNVETPNGENEHE